MPTIVGDLKYSHFELKCALIQEKYIPKVDLRFAVFFLFDSNDSNGFSIKRRILQTR